MAFTKEKIQGKTKIWGETCDMRTIENQERERLGRCPQKKQDLGQSVPHSGSIYT